MDVRICDSCEKVITREEQRAFQYVTQEYQHFCKECAILLKKGYKCKTCGNMTTYEFQTENYETICSPCITKQNLVSCENCSLHVHETRAEELNSIFRTSHICHTCIDNLHNQAHSRK